MQTTFLQAHEVILPATGALAVGQLDGQHMPAAVPTDTQGDERSAAVPDSVFAHAFVAGIEDEVGVLLFEPPGHEARQLFVELLINVADGGSTKLMAAEFLGDRLHATGGHALHVHLHQRGHQGLLAALVARKQLGRETPLPVLGHAQLELAHAGHQRTGVMPAAIAQPASGALAFAGKQGLVHLCFEYFLQEHLHQLLECVVFRQRAQQVLFCEFDRLIVRFRAGHGVPFFGWFSVVHPTTYHDPPFC